jgi:hypothetical protein
MAIRRLFLTISALCLGCLTSLAATYRTPNFVVEAATEKLAREFGDAAEHYRRVKAIEWLGQEMPPWQRPCPIRVDVSPDGPEGATTFDFGQKPIYQYMRIRGPKERLLNSVLPHEITHTVFAFYFQAPVPRWADEGGSVLSEDDRERHLHDQMCRQFLNQGRAMRLNYLFHLREYPGDVMVLYAQGFSITRFLVEQRDRATFLRFVQAGQRQGWDQAVQSFYGFPSVNALESAWIESLRRPRSAATTAVAAHPEPKASVEVAQVKASDLASRRIIRMTAPPVQPDLTPGSARASGASLGQPGERFDTRGVNRASSPTPNGLADPAYEEPTPPLPPPPPIAYPSRPARLGTPSLGPKLW